MLRTRTVYAINRYYSPETGRFTTHDPLTELDRPERLNQPQGLNLYPYVMGGPTRYTDPDGRDWMVKGYPASEYVIRWWDETQDGIANGYEPITPSNSYFATFSGWFYDSNEFYKDYAGRKMLCVAPWVRSFTIAFRPIGSREVAYQDGDVVKLSSDAPGDAEPNYIGPNGDGHGPLKVPQEYLSQKRGGKGTMYGVRPAWILGLGIYDAKTGDRLGTVREMPIEEADGPYVLLGVGSIFKTASRGAIRAAVRRVLEEGNHTIPRFLGGFSKQTLYKLPRSVHVEFHSLLRKKLKDAGMLKVGGKGGSAADWARYFSANPGSQRKALDAVLDASREIDYKYGTKVTEAVWEHVLEGAFTAIP